MHCSATPSPGPAMVHNFKKRLLRPLGYYSPYLQEQRAVPPDAPDTEYLERMNNSVTRQQWAAVTAETLYVPGCTCAFCAMRSGTDDDAAGPLYTTPQPHLRSHARRSLPSFRSVMEVLYPPSYLSVTSPFPEPPSYSRCDSPVYPARRDDAEISPLTTISVEGTPLSQRLPDPLAQDPSLTGVPSQWIHSSRVLLTEPNPLIVDLVDVPEEPLPAYSSFDHRRPRFPAVSDILGPYPPLSVLRPSSP